MRLALPSPAIAAFVTLITLAASSAHADRRPAIVAVIDIADHTRRFSPEQLERWRLHLSAGITAAKRYRVSAPEQLRALLAELKRVSFDPTYDEHKRALVGRELPAQKVLKVQLFDAGGSCAVVAELYDLERAVTDEAYSRTTACEDPRLRGALDAVALKISGEDVEEEELPEPSSVWLEGWKLTTELVTLGMGYGSTAGGAAGPVAAAELFTFRYGPLRATLIDAGTTLFASKGDFFENEVHHAMRYAGSTAGAALEFGDVDQHELRLTAGPALYRASAEADFFTGLKMNADETDGLVPAIILDTRYLFRAAEGPLELAFGGGVRAIVPLSAYTGDPRLIMARLFLSFAAL